MLIAAHCLVNGDTVTRLEGGEVEYIHLLFSQHEIRHRQRGQKRKLLSLAMRCPNRIKDTRAEVLRLFPELDTRNPVLPETARPVVRPREARALAI